MSQFAKYLRIFGGVALVSSAFVFLIQGYSTWSSFDRFLAFFGLVGVTAGAGMFCIYRLNEAKSARTFLSFMTAGVSVLFAQIGAMVFSTFNAPVSHLPSILKFEGLNMGSIALALGLTSILLVPATLPAFRALIRPRARELFEGFLALNMLLLIPVRQVEVVSVLFLIGTAYVAYLIWQSRREAVHFNTVEGKIAHVILCAPLLILFGRGLFYDQGFHLAATAMMALGLGLPFLNRGLNPRPAASLVEPTSLFLLMISWGHWAGQITEYMKATSWTGTYIFILPVVAMCMIYERQGLYPRPIVRFVLSMLTLINLGLAFAEPGTGTYILILALGAATSLWGFVRKDRQAFGIGGINVGYSIIGQIILGLRLIESWTWLSLAICGVVGILLASLVEKNSLDFKDRYQRLMANFE